eukprot:6390893-Prymnesium_polylepis.1
MPCLLQKFQLFTSCSSGRAPSGIEFDAKTRRSSEKTLGYYISVVDVGAAPQVPGAPRHAL